MGRKRNISILSQSPSIHKYSSLQDLWGILVYHGVGSGKIGQLNKSQKVATETCQSAMNANQKV